MALLDYRPTTIGGIGSPDNYLQGAALSTSQAVDSFVKAANAYSKLSRDYTDRRLLNDLANAYNPNDLNSINTFIKEKVANGNYNNANLDTLSGVYSDRDVLNQNLNKDNLFLAKQQAGNYQSEIDRAIANGNISAAIQANNAAHNYLVNNNIRKDAVTYGSVESLKNNAADRALKGASARQTHWGVDKDLALIEANELVTKVKNDIRATLHAYNFTENETDPGRIEAARLLREQAIQDSLNNPNFKDVLNSNPYANTVIKTLYEDKSIQPPENTFFTNSFSYSNPVNGVTGADILNTSSKPNKLNSPDVVSPSKYVYPKSESVSESKSESTSTTKANNTENQLSSVEERNQEPRKDLASDYQEANNRMLAENQMLLNRRTPTYKEGIDFSKPLYASLGDPSTFDEVLRTNRQAQQNDTTLDNSVESNETLSDYAVSSGILNNYLQNSIQPSSDNTVQQIYNMPNLVSNLDAYNSGLRNIQGGIQPNINTYVPEQSISNVTSNKNLQNNTNRPPRDLMPISELPITGMPYRDASQELSTKQSGMNNSTAPINEQIAIEDNIKLGVNKTIDDLVNKDLSLQETEYTLQTLESDLGKLKQTLSEKANLKYGDRQIDPVMLYRMQQPTSKIPEIALKDSMDAAANSLFAIAAENKTINLSRKQVTDFVAKNASRQPDSDDYDEFYNQIDKAVDIMMNKGVTPMATAYILADVVSGTDRSSWYNWSKEYIDEDKIEALASNIKNAFGGTKTPLELELKDYINKVVAVSDAKTHFNLYNTNINKALDSAIHAYNGDFHAAGFRANNGQDLNKALEMSLYALRVDQEMLKKKLSNIKFNNINKK